MASELESDLQDTVDWCSKWLVGFNAAKTQQILFDQSNKNGVVDVKMDGSFLEERSSFKMLWWTFSAKLDWGSYIISMLKLTPIKLEPWFVLWSFFLLRLLCISINLQFAMHGILLSLLGWCFCLLLGILDKLQKLICRTVGPSLAATLEHLVHCRNVASLSLFCRYYFDWCSSELAEVVPLPYSQGRSTSYSGR